MSIAAIGSGQTPTAQQLQQMQQMQQLQQTHHHGLGTHKAGMDAAAKALNMSTSDLQAALKSGQTIASLAQSKDVSIDTLTSTISSTLTKANPALSSDRAQVIAQRMINGPQSA